MTIKSKKDCFYKIRPCNQENQVKNVDLSKRIVQGIFNTLYYIDSDMEMLVSGVANKSLIINFPGSPKAVGEILEFLLPSIEHPLKLILKQLKDCQEDVQS